MKFTPIPTMALLHTAFCFGRSSIPTMKVSTVVVKTSAQNSVRFRSCTQPQLLKEGRSSKLCALINSRRIASSVRSVVWTRRRQSSPPSICPYTSQNRTLHSHSNKSAVTYTGNSWHFNTKSHPSRSSFYSISLCEHIINSTDHLPGHHAVSFFHTTPNSLTRHILSNSQSHSQLNLCTKPSHVLMSEANNQDPHYSLRTSTQFSTASKIVEVSPKSLQPYLKLIRFDKPIGTWLLYWPCTWSIALAAQPGAFPDLTLLALFGAGAFFMRGAGCIINDMWDKDFDDKVERTKTRPLAAKDITPFQALVFLGSQLSCALAILLQLNLYSIILGASSMALVVLYPLAKRYTYWPQLVLGLAFNWGTLLGYSAVTGSLNLGICLPLYISGILWTITYDTIYAHQDKTDDILIGVKSTAIYLGDQTKPVLAGFTTAMAGSLALAGHMADMTWPYYVGVGITAARLFQQIHSINLDETEECAEAFRGNFYLGAVLFAGIVMSNLMKKAPEEESTSPSQASSEELQSDEQTVTTREQFINQLNKDKKKDKVFFMPK